MGLGTLTKVTFPLPTAGPLLVVAAQIVLARRPVAGRRLLVNLAGAALVYLLVVAPWYGVNFSPTLEYVRSTTGGPLSLGGGAERPLHVPRDRVLHRRERPRIAERGARAVGRFRSIVAVMGLCCHRISVVAATCDRRPRSL